MPCEYEGSPNTRDIAEAAFLRVLAREANGSKPPAAPPRPRSTLGPAAPRLRTHGQATGSAFAQIGGADYNRAVSYATAIRSGVREVERRDTEARDYG
jgi:hypothetical protein